MIWWVSLFILGEIISLHLSNRGIIFSVFGVLCFLLGTPVFLHKIWNIKIQKIVVIMGVFFFIIGVIVMNHLICDVSQMKCFYDKPITFEGTIIKIDKKTTKTYYIVKLQKIKVDENIYGLRRKIRVEMKKEYQGDFERIVVPGMKLTMKGTGMKFRNATNPGGYDEEQYEFSDGVFLDIKNAELIEIKDKSFLKEKLYIFREKWKTIFYILLEEREASLACAMVLGEKSSIDQEVKDLYQKNGIAHLIAISGLHIAMIGGTLYKLLRKMIGGFGVPVSMGICFILLYGMLTGMAGATVRAIIMLILFFLADLFGRKYDILTAVNISLAFMLYINPYQFRQAGFLLSYGAVLGIAYINPIWKDLYPKLPKCLEGLMVSISVQLILTPVMLYYFYEIPIYSIFLNVIVVPLMSALLAFLLIGSGIGSLCTSLGTFVMLPAKGIFKLYEMLCNVNEKLPGAVLCTGRPSFQMILFYYIGLCLLLILLYKRRWIYERITSKMFMRIYIILAMLFLTTIYISFAKKGPLMLCMFDVGQGDGIFFETPKHHFILMDGGSSTKKEVGKYVLEGGLKYYGCNKVDYAFISHSDSDHYSGIKELLEDNRIEVRNVILPQIENKDEAYEELVSLAKKRECKVYYMKQGDSLLVDEVQFTCLSPKREIYEDKNQGCLVLDVVYENKRILLTGDMDEIIEEELIEEGRIQKKYDILKVSHHGSKTASSTDFLNIVSPEYAIISVGEHNRYGHPHQQVLERLKNSGASVIRTDQEGAVVFMIEKNTIKRKR